MRRQFIIILATCSSRIEAKGICRALLAKRLVACASTISGVKSLFWWKGKIDRAKETLVILKTKDKNFSAVEKEIRRLHSYDVPEVIALPIIAGSKKYLNWIDLSIKKQK